MNVNHPSLTYTSSSTTFSKQQHPNGTHTHGIADVEIDMCGYRPSGCALPFILRRKKSRNSSGNKGTATNRHAVPASARMRELSDALQQSEMVLAEIQRQLVSSEEAYYDDTAQTGNVFRGWDGYLDQKANGAAAQITGGASKRKMALDDRWFSQSCVHVKAGTAPYVVPGPGEVGATVPVVSSSSAVLHGSSHVGVGYPERKMKRQVSEPVSMRVVPNNVQSAMPAVSGASSHLAGNSSTDQASQPVQKRLRRLKTS